MSEKGPKFDYPESEPVCAICQGAHKTALHRSPEVLKAKSELGPPVCDHCGGAHKTEDCPNNQNK